MSKATGLCYDEIQPYRSAKRGIDTWFRSTICKRHTAAQHQWTTANVCITGAASIVPLTSQLTRHRTQVFERCLHAWVVNLSRPSGAVFMPD